MRGLKGLAKPHCWVDCHQPRVDFKRKLPIPANALRVSYSWPSAILTQADVNMGPMKVPRGSAQMGPAAKSLSGESRHAPEADAVLDFFSIKP